MGRICQEKTPRKIVAQILAQNLADYARMMAFYPTYAAVNG
jgi:hypothetical protein